MKILICSCLTLSFFLSISSARAGTEGMPSMPRIEAKKVYSVPSEEEGERLLEDRGFGDKEPEVRMMNLMMVEGSGFEGMDMDDMSQADMKHASTKGHHAGHKAVTASDEVKNNANNEIELTARPESPIVGANKYEFKALPKSKIKAEVYMTNMDMGIDSPKVKEIRPGIYQVKANFSMAGPWALKITTPRGEQVFDIQVKKK